MLGRLEEAVTAVSELQFRDSTFETQVRKALRPFFDEQLSVEVDLDLEGHPDALVEELWAKLGNLPINKPTIREMVERHLKALAAELQPAPRVSEEKIEAAVEDWCSDWEDVGSRDGLRECLQRHFQPKPKPQVWPKLARDGYPDDWTSVEEWVPRDGDMVLMAGKPPLSAPTVWSGIWPDPNATHWCRLKEPPGVTLDVQVPHGLPVGAV